MSDEAAVRRRGAPDRVPRAARAARDAAGRPGSSSSSGGWTWPRSRTPDVRRQPGEGARPRRNPARLAACASSSAVDLDRFLFEPEDVVVAVGQDGLVANVAKYLDGQPRGRDQPRARPLRRACCVRTPSRPSATCSPAVAGGRGDRAAHDGRGDVRRRPAAARPQRAVRRPRVATSRRATAAAWAGTAERTAPRPASSSPPGPARRAGPRSSPASAARCSRCPRPTDPRLAFFVREAWPSAAPGRADRGARRGTRPHRLTCEIGEGGVVFGDGIEADAVRLDWGQRVLVGAADERLRLVR